MYTPTNEQERIARRGQGEDTTLLRYGIRVTFYVRWRIQRALDRMEDQGQDAVY